MKRYDAAPVLRGLKDFQRATVEHVVDRFYGDDPCRRFLVADETGLGKSVVARGVIAKTLERLQDEPEVRRVDVVYVCSNQDIAAQNLARLQVTAGESVTMSSRLTMLGKHSKQLSGVTAREGKPVNLVAFTPGTSFDRGWRTGKAEERAMLFLLLERALDWSGWDRHAALRAFQGTSRSVQSFTAEVDRLAEALGDDMDRRIEREFLRLIRKSGELRDVKVLLEDIGRSRTLPPALSGRSYDLIGRLRARLARAGVETLEPDLVILDEFQRFRHLLSLDEGNEAAELAHHLFDYGEAKVLLLSATPYKPFTFSEESAGGDDHHKDFRKTLSFLCDDPRWNRDVAASFEAYRDAMVRGKPVEQSRAKLRKLLMQFMCRTERPVAAQEAMLSEHVETAADVRSGDVSAYAALRRVAAAVEAPASIEYWKSAPYFLNFTEGYKLGEQLRKHLKAGDDTDLAELLDTAQLLDAGALSSFQPVDMGNGRLRQLESRTTGQGWWRLLWVPPSMPYFELQEPFATAAGQGMTKQLLFSSWTATPTAVAGLLSYEADRQIAGGHLSRNDPVERARIASRLDYRLDVGRPSAMSALALFWPHPELAALLDPLAIARATPNVLLVADDVEQTARASLQAGRGASSQAREDAVESTPWESLFRFPGAIPAGLTPALAELAFSSPTSQSTDPEAELGGRGLAEHVAQAFEVAAASDQTSVGVGSPSDDLVRLGLHSPGNTAWRALSRLLGPDSTVTSEGHWRAAARLTGGLRSLFNRAESTLLLDALALDSVYWRAVLSYCAAGNLQAVLDEYLHHLRSSVSDAPLDDDRLLALAGEAAATLSIRPSTYRAFDPATPDTPIPLRSRFALRYGGRSDDAESARQPEVRNAFNSPFWPFVVATTSAGQEGIDFHWWCSSVVHWNTPTNPVDFEQREGRVHRFGGHAVRRNVAARHRVAALASSTSDIWKAAYDAASEYSSELGDFAPYWVYPGSSTVQRHVMPYPLSRDLQRLAQLKEDLVLYRLAFGQPRQEDMLELLRRNGVDASQAANEALDLRPAIVTPNSA